MSKETAPLIRHVPLTQARASLGTIVNEVNRTNEYVVVERGGLPVAVIMDFDEFEDYLDVRDPATRARIAKASREYREGKAIPAESLVSRLQPAVAGKSRKKTVKTIRERLLLKRQRSSLRKRSRWLVRKRMNSFLMFAGQRHQSQTALKPLPYGASQFSETY